MGRRSSQGELSLPLALDIIFNPFLPDQRQTMGQHYRHPWKCTLQAHPRSSPLLPRQGRRAKKHCQHQQHLGYSRQRWSSELCFRKGRSCWA